MSKRICIAALLFFSIDGLMKSSVAQSVHFQMNVQPELYAEVMQDLSFGTLITGSGEHRISKESPRVGIFHLRALNGQKILVSVQMPDSLQHENTAIADRLPLSLQAAYSPSDKILPKQSIPFQQHSALLNLAEQSRQTSQTSTWKSRYVFIYGAVTVKDVVPGKYHNELVLTVEYQ